MPTVPDPLVVEYLRQRDGSKLRRWRDVDTGMCMTLIALDPIRDAVFKTAFDAHLNGLRADGSHRWHDVAAGRSRSLHAHDRSRCPAHPAARLTVDAIGRRQLADRVAA